MNQEGKQHADQTHARVLGTPESGLVAEAVRVRVTVGMACFHTFPLRVPLLLVKHITSSAHQPSGVRAICLMTLALGFGRSYLQGQPGRHGVSLWMSFVDVPQCGNREGKQVLEQGRHTHEGLIR